MAVYAVGDIQGCLDELRDLLDALTFDADKDRLWLVGDLVNRGPKSLETLRFVRSLGDAAITVLGNHDLHLLALAIAPGARSPEKDLRRILKAKDGDELIEWLLHRPLLHYDKKLESVLVHAGIYPGWTLKKARALAKEVEAVLQGPQPEKFLQKMYGGEPALWSDDLTGTKRLRFIVNSFTRMRFCRPDGSLDFSAKLGPEDYDGDIVPWYQMPKRKATDVRIVFGHWSTLGYHEDGYVLSLDTGCVWGGLLTAAQLDEHSPLVQVRSRQPRRY
ncbi:MAG: symmetrical bis(5'-nucleosyl)-tetraphosphatase [Gammaproteobacteria bacterium]|nr:symmetrical bis(5'-nucleosyl)-tetraphosphatase [Gammaproteobacteria bacterium]NND53935.1 symmetrical bis(5'-nucleosyl)-tetraphosphatase [Gammaproteobacteria bacterium]